MPVQTCRWVKEEHVRSVPCTTYKNVEETKTCQIPYQVCKQVPYTVTHRVARCVAKQVPTTYTRMVARCVPKQVAYEVCQMVPTTVCNPAPTGCSSCGVAAPAGEAQEHKVLKPEPETQELPKEEVVPKTDAPKPVEDGAPKA